MAHWLKKKKKKSASYSERHRKHGFNFWVGKIPWRRKCQLTPEFLLGKSHGQRNLAGYSPWSYKRTGYNLVTKQQQQGIFYTSLHGKA